MASGMYTFGIGQLMRGNIDLVNDTIAVVAVSTAYTPDLSSHQYQNDIPDAAQIGEVDLEGNILIDNTVFDANSATIEEPTTGEEHNAVVVFNNTGNATTSQLLAYLEVSQITTDGTPLVVDWDADGIFEL